MEASRVDDRPGGVALRVRYHDHYIWFNTLPPLVVLGSGFVLEDASFTTLTPIIWLVGTLLFLVNGLFTALRSERGLTLYTDGITWHRTELFIPWSQVSELVVDTNLKEAGSPHLIVRTATPDDALDGQRGLSKFFIQANIHQYGGPIAVRARHLSVRAETVIATAEQLRRAPAASRVDYARRNRPRAIAAFCASAAFAGFVAAVAAIVLPLVY